MFNPLHSHIRYDASDNSNFSFLYVGHPLRIRIHNSYTFSSIVVNNLLLINTKLF